MKNSFIPINNDIDKAIAFAPSLDKAFRDRNSIKQKEHYIETLDVIENLQNQGWNIVGVCEQRGKNRKIASNFIKLEHSDFRMFNKRNVEGTANLYVSNSCNGSKPLNLDFGMHRLVCSNGLVRRTSFIEHKLNHNQKTLSRIPMVLANVNKAAEQVLTEFNKFKEVELTEAQINEIARKAARLRFDNNDVDVKQLLTIHRNEDQGNDLWSVFNRVQENLIKPGMLIDRNGRLISGIDNVKQNIQLNQDLFSLVETYAF